MFPWTYDQLQRYHVLRLVAGAMERREGGLRILDVGGAAPVRSGQGLWLPAKAAVRDSRVFVLDVAEAQEPDFIRASGTRLPFKDGSFDLVSALDVLEHVEGESRAAFLAELARVSGGAVVLSCPVKDPSVEAAEAVIDGEIRRLYGVGHGMLEEHRERGLPAAGEVEAGLEAAGLPGGVSFGYGSVANWLAYLAFRSSFLFRRDSDRAVESIDRWWAGQPQAAELLAPFYRRFWLASKTMDPGPLEAVAAEVKRGLTEGLIVIESPSLGSMIESSGRFLAGDFVSAVVVTRGEKARLSACLDALLTQRVDFDLEIAVWDIGGGSETPAWLGRHYPPVGVFTVAAPNAGAGGSGPGGDDGGSGPKGRACRGVADLVARLRGGHVFLVDDAFVPAPDAVASYLAAAKAGGRDDVLAVAAAWRGGFPKAWAGPRWNRWRKAEGLKIRMGQAANPARLAETHRLVPRFKGWVLGDGLFFERYAIGRRKDLGAEGGAAGLSVADVFLWEFGSE